MWVLCSSGKNNIYLPTYYMDNEITRGSGVDKLGLMQKLKLLDLERLENTNEKYSNKLLQLAMQHCCVASWKAQTLSLNKISLLQVELVSTFFNYYHILSRITIRATLFSLQHNNVALQVEEKCCPYYRAFMYVCAQYYHLLTVAIVILTYPLYIYSIV